jgi:hypothetical protein
VPEGIEGSYEHAACVAGIDDVIHEIVPVVLGQIEDVDVLVPVPA